MERQSQVSWSQGIEEEYAEANAQERKEALARASMLAQALTDAAERGRSVAARSTPRGRAVCWLYGGPTLCSEEPGRNFQHLWTGLASGLPDYTPRKGSRYPLVSGILDGISRDRASAPFKLIGAIDQELTSRVPSDEGDPVRQAAVEVAVKYLRQLSTIDLVAIIPTLVRYATSGGLTDPGPPPGSEAE